MKKHIVRSFDQMLDAVGQTVVSMGRLAEQQLRDATAALFEHSSERCESVLAADKDQDAALLSIENQVIDLLVLRQPMAADLRSVIGALRGARDLERIGDYAKNIAKHATTLSRFDCRDPLEQLRNLAEPVAQMLTDLVNTLERMDSEQASRVRAMDVEVDRLYTTLFQAVLSDMEAGTLAPTIGTHILFVARCYERIGDHITNVAEDVIFQVNGHLPADERERRDLSAFAVGAR